LTAAINQDLQRKVEDASIDWEASKMFGDMTGNLAIRKPASGCISFQHFSKRERSNGSGDAG